MLDTTDSRQSGLASSMWLQQLAGFSTGDIKSLPSLSLPVSVIPQRS